MTVNGVHLTTFVAAILAAGLLRAVPLVAAALGEAVAERAGLLNLGIEGMMLSGCFFGFWAAYRTNSLLWGMAAAVAAGLVLGLVFGVLTISCRVDQVLVGLAITIFSAGLTGFLFRDVFAGQNVAADINPRLISIPWLRDLPVIGGPLFREQLLFYVTWLLVPLFAFILMRTRFGLNVRAVGENPFAADAAGVNVVRTRYLAIAAGGAMAGFAGGFLCVSDLKIFTVGMTVGQGFIALAIAMLGKWRPYRIMAGAVMFGMLVSLGDGLQLLGVSPKNVQFIGMAPYVGVMLGLVVLAGRSLLPSALGVPYTRGAR